MEASQFGKYRLLQHIASGGMAEIWLAEPLEAKTPQRLVIKIIRREHLERAEYRAMFLEEARLNAAVSHTNVVGVHERGEVDGVPFLVLEYVNGLDLRALLHTLAMHGAKLPLPIAVHIVREVALGMHAAHTAQDEQCRPLRLVHRDVCPHNILLGFEGQVKISDFGIAHGTDAASGSRPGQLTGRAGYLSPEQCAGLTIDHRTDIFSLGIVLYEATVGRRLFRGPSRIETQQMIKEARITPPTEVLPDYPKELEAIVLRALARAPEQRYATAEALARDLSLFLARTAEEVDQPELSSYLQTLAPAVQEAAEAREERSSSFITPLPAPGPAPDAGASNPPAADEAANDEDTPPAEEEAAAPPAPAEQMPVGPLRSPPPEPEKPAPPPKREPSQPLPAQRPMAASHSIPKLAPGGAEELYFEMHIEPEMKGRRWPRLARIAVVLVLVLIAGLLTYRAIIRPRVAPVVVKPEVVPTPAAMPLATDATLEVNAQPAGAWVELDIGGEPLPSPAKISLASGRSHSLLIQLPGHHVYRTRFFIADPQGRHVENVTLRPLEEKAPHGRVFVETSPEGAQLFWGGTSQGTAPGLLTLPAEEDQVLRLRLEGHVPQNVLVTPRADVDSVARVTLARAEGEDKERELRVRSLPEGASVSVNGRKLGPTPFFDRYPKGALVTLRLEKEGHEPWERDLVLDAANVQVEARLVRRQAPQSQLTIQSNRPARIFLGSEEQGKAPLKLTLPAGKHDVVLQTEKDTMRATFQVNLEPGEILERKVLFDDYGNYNVE